MFIKFKENTPDINKMFIIFDPESKASWSAVCIEKTSEKLILDLYVKDPYAAIHTNRQDLALNENQTLLWEYLETQDE